VPEILCRSYALIVGTIVHGEWKMDPFLLEFSALAVASNLKDTIRKAGINFSHAVFIGGTIDLK
jgi:hypothetical protein